MFKTRIASTAAIFTFGLAAIGGTVVAIAAPANAEPGSSSSVNDFDVYRILQKKRVNDRDAAAYVESKPDEAAIRAALDAGTPKRPTGLTSPSGTNSTPSTGNKPPTPGTGAPAPSRPTLGSPGGH